MRMLRRSGAASRAHARKQHTRIKPRPDAEKEAAPQLCVHVRKPALELGDLRVFCRGLLEQPLDLRSRISAPMPVRMSEERA